MRSWNIVRLSVFLLGVFLLASCTSISSFDQETARPQPTSTPEGPETRIPSSTPTAEPTAAPTEIKPTWIPTPSELPLGYEQSIPFDGIYPVYTPFFVSAEEAPFDDEELVLGVAWEGEAKAYPITVLRFREMVNDELAGIPTLVTY